MKTRKINLIIIVLLSTMIFNRCTSTVQNVAVIDTAFIFKAEINGKLESWKTSNYQSLLSGGISINAFYGSEKKIQLVLINSKSKGIYPVENYLAMINYWDAKNIAHSADSGTIIIRNESDQNISGSFSFVENQGITVTNGVFNNVPKTK